MTTIREPEIEADEKWPSRIRECRSMGGLRINYFAVDSAAYEASDPEWRGYEFLSLYEHQAQITSLELKMDKMAAALEFYENGGEPYSLDITKDNGEKATKGLQDYRKWKAGNNRCSHGVWLADRCFKCDPNIGVENRK